MHAPRGAPPTTYGGTCLRRPLKGLYRSSPRAQVVVLSRVIRLEIIPLGPSCSGVWGRRSSNQNGRLDNFYCSVCLCGQSGLSSTQKSFLLWTSDITSKPFIEHGCNGARRTLSAHNSAKFIQVWYIQNDPVWSVCALFYFEVNTQKHTHRSVGLT